LYNPECHENRARERMGPSRWRKVLDDWVNVLDQDLYRSVNSVQVLLRIIEATQGGFDVSLPVASFAARVPADVWTAV